MKKERLIEILSRPGVLSIIAALFAYILFFFLVEILPLLLHFKPDFQEQWLLFFKLWLPFVLVLFTAINICIILLIIKKIKK